MSFLLRSSAIWFCINIFCCSSNSFCCSISSEASVEYASSTASPSSSYDFSRASIWSCKRWMLRSFRRSPLKRFIRLVIADTVPWMPWTIFPDANPLTACAAPPTAPAMLLMEAVVSSSAPNADAIEDTPLIDAATMSIASATACQASSRSFTARRSSPSASAFL